MNELYQFTCLFWQHIKKHLQTDLVKGSQDEVERFSADTEAIVGKYQDNPPLMKFVKSCLLAYMTYLEETNEN